MAKKLKTSGGKLRFPSDGFCSKLLEFFHVLSLHPRVLQTTRHPSRLIRPSPINCDKVSEQPVKIFPFVAHFFVRASQNKMFIGYPIYSVDLHTPQKEKKPIAWFSLPGGHFSHDKRWRNKNTLLGIGILVRFSLYVRFLIHLRIVSILHLRISIDLYQSSRSLNLAVSQHLSSRSTIKSIVHQSALCGLSIRLILVARTLPLEVSIIWGAPAWF